MSRLVLAALAAIPERAGFLPQVLRSLRPHVDRLCVYLNGWTEAPKSVHDMADDFVVDPENGGAERKLWWAQDWDGHYCSVDDDFVYPPNYVATMVEAVERWRGLAFVTAHGRQYVDQPRNVHQVVPGSVGIVHRNVHQGGWVNHGGTGVMAWDAAQIQVPRDWPESNMVDMQLACWAQDHRIPMWLVSHPAHWLEPLAMLDPRGIFRASQAEGHRRRNLLLQSRDRWSVYHVAPTEPAEATA